MRDSESKRTVPARPKERRKDTSRKTREARKRLKSSIDYNTVQYHLFVSNADAIDFAKTYQDNIDNTDTDSSGTKRIEELRDLPEIYFSIRDIL